MDSNGKSSRKLANLAQHLRSHKSQLGFSNPTTQNPQQQQQSGKPRKRAAVLICLFEGELRVILTKRASTLVRNSNVVVKCFVTVRSMKCCCVAGEVALPGGKTEGGDADDIQTALREAEEEIGLDPSLVDVVAILEPLINKRGITIVPVIGILANKKAFHPVLNAAEVESIFDAPLQMFLKDENRWSEEVITEGKKYLLQFFDYEAGNNRKYLIWALTAEILIRVASIVYQRLPAFTEWKPASGFDLSKADISDSRYSVLQLIQTITCSADIIMMSALVTVFYNIILHVRNLNFSIR